MTVLIIEQLKEFKRLEPELTFGELLFQAFRPKNLKGSDLENIKWLREVKDNDFFTAFEKAITFSKEE